MISPRSRGSPVRSTGNNVLVTHIKVEKLGDRCRGSARDITQFFMATKQRLRSQYPENYDPQRERFKPKEAIMQQMHQQQRISNQLQQTTGNSNSPTMQDHAAAAKQVMGIPGNNFKHKRLVDEQNEGENLPPIWIDIQEDVDDQLVQIRNHINELGPLNAQRFSSVIFDEEGAKRLDEDIYNLVKKITTLIKKCEIQLKQMDVADELAEKNHKLHERKSHKQVEGVKQQIIKNVQQSYIARLQKYTAKMKQLEKNYKNNMQQMYGDTDQPRQVATCGSPRLQKQVVDIQDQHRQEKIPKILKQMNDLSDIYKQMNHLIIEQGTMMDRIDENLFEARYHTHLARDEVKKTHASDHSKKSQACIIFLIQSILICTAIITIQHSSW